MKRVLILLLLSFLLIGCCHNGEADSYIIENSNYEERYEAKIVRIIDGDTFVSFANNDSVRIRLSGVDTPEQGRGKNPMNQPYARNATNCVSNMILGKDVLIIPKEMDKYDRLVAWVFIDGVDLSAELLKKGLAWHFVKYDSNDNYTKLEEKARRKGLGLWQDDNPIEPWVWRKMKKEEKMEYLGIE